jgi:hypothetical protein
LDEKGLIWRERGDPVNKKQTALFLSSNSHNLHNGKMAYVRTVRKIGKSFFCNKFVPLPSLI